MGGGQEKEQFSWGSVFSEITHRSLIEDLYKE